MLLLVNDAGNSVRVAVVCLFTSNVGVAFSDVCVDALLVIQSRRYPKGAEELQTLAWSSLSIGGLFGSISAAFITQNYDPSLCFQLSGFIGLIIAIIATRLDINIETEGMIQRDPSTTLLTEMKRYLSEMGEATKVPEI